MRRWFVGVALVSALMVAPVVRMARADEDSASRDEVERSRQSQERMQREVRESEQQRKEQGAIARQRLSKEFGIDASHMSDSDAIVRLRDEIHDRDAAREQEEQRKREQAESQQDERQRELMRKQEAVLKGTFGKGSDEIADDEDAAQEKMYEQMVQKGVAPQCRGKKGEALIDCVDKAMDAQ
jgi:hypothetical protein